MTRKVICMKDNMTVPTSNCDVDSIMFGAEECNKHPCGDGKYFIFNNLLNYLIYLACYSLLVFIDY